MVSATRVYKSEKGKVWCALRRGLLGLAVSGDNGYSGDSGDRVVKLVRVVAILRVALHCSLMMLAPPHIPHSTHTPQHPHLLRK